MIFEKSIFDDQNDILGAKKTKTYMFHKTRAQGGPTGPLAVSICFDNSYGSISMIVMIPLFDKCFVSLITIINAVE